MKSSISRSAAWLFTTRGNPDEVLAALDDKTEAVTARGEQALVAMTPRWEALLA